VEEFNRENMRVPLAAFIEEYELNTRLVAKAIGCSEATIIRLLAASTLPTDKMMREVALMFQAGFARYAGLTKAERRRLWRSAEKKVVGGSVAGGVFAIPDVINAFGRTPGLSSPGIASGLKDMSGGNGMVRGIQVAAVVPIIAGTLGYGVLKGVEYFASESQLNAKKLNPEWEILNELKA